MVFMTRSILLIDDDDRFRVLAGAAVRAAGFGRVYEASSASTGREAAARLRPDAALIDIGLPDGDGLALARDLSALLHDLRIVVISAEASAADDLLAERAGAVGFVAKEELDGAVLRELLGGA
jgi:CheY-like chemotaxis protein